MTDHNVTMVQVYLTEGEGRLKKLLSCLHDEEKVRGVTVFRGVTGFGRSGRMHSSSLLELSGDLPMVIQFFDEPGKVARILEHLRSQVEPGHIVSWAAMVHEG